MTIPDKKIGPGDRAPMFTLKDEKGRRHSLQAILKRQPVLLIFYPGDLTPGCTVQLRRIRNNWKKFEDAGIAVFGINHANAESHAAFCDQYEFPFHLLVDTGKRVSQKYNAVKPFFKTSIINRTVVGIGRDGNIFYYKRGMPKDSDILKAFKATKA